MLPWIYEMEGHDRRVKRKINGIKKHDKFN